MTTKEIAKEIASQIRLACEAANLKPTRDDTTFSVEVAGDKLCIKFRKPRRTYIRREVGGKWYLYDDDFFATPWQKPVENLVSDWLHFSRG